MLEKIANLIIEIKFELVKAINRDKKGNIRMKPLVLAI